MKLFGKKEFIISVIVPVYNTEKYLQECLDSVLSQTLGFNKNIQLILVDDGSTDGSRQICLAYQQKHPKNVVCCFQENQGVACACNAGLEFAQGRYVNFLSSDDTWERDALKTALRFFRRHWDEIDMLACRLRYFEAETGFLHPLDWKYTDDYIVDLMKDYDKIVLSGGNCIFKTETVRRYRFSENLRTYEDALLIGKVLLEKHKYGVLKSAVYNYRRRYDQSSLINTDRGQKPRFLDMPKHYLEAYLDACMRDTGRIYDYVQYSVMYVLQWHLKGNGIEILDDAERRRYQSTIVRLLKRIDDKIIYKQKSINLAMKHYVFSLKHGRDLCRHSILKGGMLHYNGARIFNLKSLGRLTIRKMALCRDGIRLEGMTDLFLLGSTFELGALVRNGEFRPMEILEDSAVEQLTFSGECIALKKKFRLEMKREDIQSVQFVARSHDGRVVVLNVQ